LWLAHTLREEGEEHNCNHIIYMEKGKRASRKRSTF